MRGGVVSEYGYDRAGRVVRRTQRVDGEALTFEHRYDAEGRPDTIRYPGAEPFVLHHRYAPSGHLIALEDNEGTRLWELQSLSARGAVRRERFANGVVSENDYEPGTGRVATIRTWYDTHERGSFMDRRDGAEAPPSGDLQSWAYAYDPDGNLLERRDRRHGLVETYAYDGLDRLVRVRDNAGGRTEFRYDPLGNLVWASDEGDMPHDDTRPHALSAFHGAAQRYDANGNHLGDERRSLTWDSEDRVVRVANHETGASKAFRFDAEDNKVEATGDGTHTRFFGAYELRSDTSGSVEVLHVGYGQRVVAEIHRTTSGELQFFIHPDLLGSTDLVTASDGTSGWVDQRQTYTPFGRKRDDPWSHTSQAGLHYGFTGHRHEEELGLIDMGGRMYDPVTRKVQSVDPIVIDNGSAQAWNPYSYVLNNPLRYVDPTGHEVVERPADAPSPTNATTSVGPGTINGDGIGTITYVCDGPCEWQQTERPEEGESSQQAAASAAAASGATAPASSAAQLTFWDRVGSAVGTGLWAAAGFLILDDLDTIVDAQASVAERAVAVASVAAGFFAGPAVAAIKFAARGIKLARRSQRLRRLWDRVRRVISRPSRPSTTPSASGGGGGGGRFVPDEYWQRTAPRQVTPGTRRLDHQRVSRRTGRSEDSRVIYDQYGRQTHRVDKTDHMRPADHSNPHLHETTYAPRGTRFHDDTTGARETLHNLR